MRHFLNFLKIFFHLLAKIVYPEYDMSFDKKNSWHMTILEHFQNSATFGQFFKNFGNIFFVCQLSFQFIDSSVKE